MPYFPDKNLLFIHIPKNGGTFVEKNLGIPVDWGLEKKPSLHIEEETKSSFLGQIKQNIRNLFPTAFPREEEQIDWSFMQRKLIYGYFGEGFAFQHATLSEIIGMRLLPPEILSSSRVISIHRDPLERAKSVFKYWLWNEQFTFEEFCINYVDNPWKGKLTHSQLTHLRPQIDFISVDGQVPDWVELIPLGDISKWLLKNFGIENNKKINSSSSEIEVRVTDVCLDILKSRYAKDYEYFGYI
jgi:hypothetical protein